MSVDLREYDCICGNNETEKWLYEYGVGHKERYRYVLGKSGEKPLICFGINPSCAHLEKANDVWTAKPDPTMCRVRNVSELLGFDGYIMLNLYPLIDKNPNKLRQMDKNRAESVIETNLEYIKAVFEKYRKSDVLWACWGTSIKKKDCLIRSLQRIDELAVTYGKKWKTIKWTKAELKHPHHPLRISNDEVNTAKKFWEAKGGNTDFDVDMAGYISTL